MKRITAVIALLIFITFSAAGAQDLTIRGFAEGAFGGRTQTNRLFNNSDYTLNETRLQIQLSHFGESSEFYGAIDFLQDNITKSTSTTYLREAYFQFNLGSKADLKVGRQVLTWGTGDLLFINDVFPKDYISFFAGREDRYLKLPSDAFKLRLFASVFDVDLAVTPFFTGDQMPTGQRLSYFNPLAGGTVAGANLNAPLQPEKTLSNAEVAARIYRYTGNFQVSGYLFNGFYKSPMGIDITRGGMYYPELSVYGTSIRGPLWAGILSAEYGYYDSREDSDGSNPLIPNSQHRFLLGFERQWWTDFTMGIQYYGEYMKNHENYLRSLMPGMPVSDEMRNVYTMRITQMLKYQTITLSVFGFVSPSDEDWHVRPSATYKYSDQVAVTIGGNFFGGEKNYTLFGQFENNNNIYSRFRYYF